MACVTLKRNHEFDPIYQGSSGSCSPRAHKRRRLNTMSIAGPKVNTPSTSSIQNDLQSAFVDAVPRVTPEQIAHNVREQIIFLKRRKGLQQQNDKQMECDDSPPASPTTMALRPASPSSFLASSPYSHLMKDATSMLNMKQVYSICEQLLIERESQLRLAYDKVLYDKLAEQYDCFVRFTTDQIQTGLSRTDRPSYLS